MGNAPVWHWLTRVAFAIALVVVVARFMTSEVIRDPWDTSPGGAALPRAAGAASGVVLDLICGVPVLLILARAVLDQSFLLARRSSDAVMLALGLWTLASVGWASDRFIAAVSAAHVLAAIALLWTASQTVRSWMRLRLVAAVGCGLLLVLVAQSVLYRAIDVQANVRYWQDNRKQILQERGWEEGSFFARQFEQKLTNGDLAGFFNSPNTFAAAGVMLLFVTMGISLEKRAEGEHRAWGLLAVIAAAAASWIIVEARSKTAAATPVLGIVVLLFVRWKRTAIRARPDRTYWAGVGACVAAVLAVVGHGLYHHGLFPGHFSNSLDFRWKYWIASLHLFAAHPWAGVGWANFGRYYLQYRLPEASEEIKDPHNLIVRAFTELGIVGGAMLLIWVLRAAWELVHGAAADLDEAAPLAPGQPAFFPPATRGTIGWAAAVVLAGVVLNVLVTIDFFQPAADVVLELMRRILYLLVLLIGTLGAAMRTPQRPDLDDRRGPWVFNGILVGVLLLLVHNLIDFSLFETGVLCVTSLLIGAAMGIRPRNMGWTRGWAGVALATSATAWLLAAVLFAGPIVVAEQDAADANESIRTAPSDELVAMHTHWSQAAQDLLAAHRAVPYNSEYLFRAGRASIAAGDESTGRSLLALTEQSDPRWIDPYLLQANLELRRTTPHPALVTRDFDRIVRLNPNDVSLRTQQGEALERLGRWREAASAFDAAVRANDALPVGEPKKLTDTQRDELIARRSADSARG